MQTPSIELWLQEAKACKNAGEAGIYLVHNGVVRATARKSARSGENSPPVLGMEFSSDPAELSRIEAETRAMPGVLYLRCWLNSGVLAVGEDLMLVLIGADIRPRAVDALNYFVGSVKSRCVSEQELY